MPTQLFDTIDLSQGEKKFVDNVLKDDKEVRSKTAYAMQAQVLATLHLSKNIENAVSEIKSMNKSSSRSSAAMIWLTVALVLCTFAQVGVTIWATLHK